MWQFISFKFYIFSKFSYFPTLPKVKSFHVGPDWFGFLFFLLLCQTLSPLLIILVRITSMNNSHLFDKCRLKIKITSTAENKLQIVGGSRSFGIGMLLCLWPGVQNPSCIFGQLFFWDTLYHYQSSLLIIFVHWPINHLLLQKSYLYNFYT